MSDIVKQVLNKYNNQKVRIHWFMKKNHYSGHGKPIERHLAQAWIDHLTPRHPDMHHYINQYSN